MPKKYDIIVTATISIGGVYEAESAQLAVELARMELRAGGELSNIDVERAVYLDEEEPENAA